MATRSLAALVAVLAVIPASAIAAPPAPSSASCTVSAQGPFLYVDIVIPVASVQCDTQQRRLHIETELTRERVPLVPERVRLLAERRRERTRRSRKPALVPDDSGLRRLDVRRRSVVVRARGVLTTRRV